MRFYQIYRRLAVIILLTALSLFQAGCEKGTKSEFASSKEEAIAAIDKGDFDRAISLLEPHIQEQPYDQRARVILASAYAAKGGMVISRFVDFGREIIESTKTADEFFNNRMVPIFEKARANKLTTDQQNVFGALETAYRVAWRLSDIMRKFEAIPLIRDDRQLALVQRAVNILAADSDLQGGPALYRGLLRLTVFRYNVGNKAYFSELFQQCWVDLHQLSRDLDGFYRELRLILIDVAQSASKREKQEKIWRSIGKSDDEVAKAVRWLRENSIGKADARFIVRQAGGKCE